MATLPDPAHWYTLTNSFLGPTEFLTAETSSLPPHHVNMQTDPLPSTNWQILPLPNTNNYILRNRAQSPALALSRMIYNDVPMPVMYALSEDHPVITSPNDPAIAMPLTPETISKNHQWTFKAERHYLGIRNVGLERDDMFLDTYSGGHNELYIGAWLPYSGQLWVLEKREAIVDQRFLPGASVVPEVERDAGLIEGTDASGGPVLLSEEDSHVRGGTMDGFESTDTSASGTPIATPQTSRAPSPLGS